MVIKSRYELSQEANPAIINALKERIPFFKVTHIDENAEYVSQLDLFGNTDLVTDFGSTKMYNLQNKSRSGKPGYTDICIECIAYKGKVADPDSGKYIPVSGAYYYEPDDCWLVPNLRMADGISIYMKHTGRVLNFARYYLDILFSYNGVWTSCMTGVKKFESDTMHCIYGVYFDTEEFIKLYLNCVAYVVTG